MEGIEQHGQFEMGAASPAKSLFRIGEVSRLTATKPFVLRYWETEFPMLQPVKSPKGHRLYRREDIDTVFTIKRLLYNDGFTIAGARRHLREQGPGTASGNSGVSGSGMLPTDETPRGGEELSARHAPVPDPLAMLNR